MPVPGDAHSSVPLQAFVPIPADANSSSSLMAGGDMVRPRSDEVGPRPTLTELQAGQEPAGAPRGAGLLFDSSGWTVWTRSGRSGTVPNTSAVGITLAVGTPRVTPLEPVDPTGPLPEPQVFYNGTHGAWASQEGTTVGFKFILTWHPEDACKEGASRIREVRTYTYEGSGIVGPQGGELQVLGTATYGGDCGFVE